MSIASSLIDDLNAGVPLPILTSQYSWLELSILEREEIFSYVQTGDEQAKCLLRLIVSMALTGPGCDPWDEARILSMGIQYMGWENFHQGHALDQLLQVLDRLEQNISALSVDDQARLVHYRAEYFELFARYLADEDKVIEAIKTFTQALNLYTQYGDKKSVHRVKKQIHIYEEIERNRGHIIPDNEIDNERVRLRTELAELSRQTRLKTSELEQLDKKLQDRQERWQRQSMQLQAEREQVEFEIRQKHQQDQAAVDQAHQEMEAVTAKLNDCKPLLEFFVSLSTLTTGPLWLEIVKMALDQREMDDLALQALQRLAIRFPEQSSPLIKEVFTRLPEVSSENILAHSKLLDSWVLKIQQAEQIYPSDKFAAARLIVEAWEDLCRQN